MTASRQGQGPLRSDQRHVRERGHGCHELRDYCMVMNQYSCSGCPGACNAMCRYNPLSLRN